MIKKVTYSGIGVIFIVLGIFIFDLRPDTAESKVQTFDQCVDAGYVVFPGEVRVCTTSAGRVFKELPGSVFAQTEYIEVTEPNVDETVSSPVTLLGNLRGDLFSEGSFLVTAVSDVGEELGSAVVLAHGDWDTNVMVSFRGELEYRVATDTPGLLVLSSPTDTFTRITIPVFFEKNLSNTVVGSTTTEPFEIE